MLDEFLATTGMHRKAVIRLLNRRNKSPGKKRSERPQLYGLEVMTALKVVWEATDRLRSRRLHPFLPDLTGILKRSGELRVTEETKARLYRISPATTACCGAGVVGHVTLLVPLNQAHFSRRLFRCGPFASGKIPGLALLRLTLLPTVERAQRVSISPHYPPLTWRLVGVSPLRYGGRDMSVSVAPSTM
jgi:hypothetical protein